MITAIVLLVVVIGAAATAVIYKFTHGGKLPWKPLKGWAMTEQLRIQYIAPLDFTDAERAKLNQAIGLAADCLGKHNVNGWSRATVISAIYDLHIFVSFTPTWKTPYGTVVAGETTGPNVVYVGRDLKALCHEMRHSIAWLLTGNPQQEHEGWDRDTAFIAAINEYEAAVNKLGAQ